MQNIVTRRPFGADHLRSIAARVTAGRQTHRSAAVLAAALWIASLSGCAPGVAEHAPKMADSTTADSRVASRVRTPVPLPRAALLKPQTEPKCEYRGSGNEKGKEQPQPAKEQPQAAKDQPQAAKDQPEPGPDVAKYDDALRAKLYYERQCYRQSEMLVRARLHQLQASVAETINAVRRNEE
jgi:hypothetical protein